MTDSSIDRKRADRLRPPPPDWPDGDDGAVFRWDLVCGLRSVVARLPQHEVDLMLATRSVTDMRGAIALALDIDPRVRLIATYSGDVPDTVYVLVDGNWQARDARPRFRDDDTVQSVPSAALTAIGAA